jgi:hypothetical protein
MRDEKIDCRMQVAKSKTCREQEENGEGRSRKQDAGAFKSATRNPNFAM